MTSVQLKSRLIQLIQKEGDVGLLKLLDRLMDRSSEESAYREMLAYGVEHSEADIKADRVFFGRSQDQLKSIFTEEVIYVSDIFDSRQDPIRMRGKRNPRSLWSFVHTYQITIFVV